MKPTSLLLFQKLISGLNFPGRYVLSEILGPLLMPNSGSIEGKIGIYPITLDLRDQLQRQIYFGLYELAELKLLHKLLRPGDVFFDIGANVGYFSFIASQIIGEKGKVHAFEPISNNVSLFKNNVKANCISNIIINQLAVSNRTGFLTLFYDDNSKNSGWASVIKSSRRITHPVTFDAICIDDYIRLNSIRTIRLIKLDIEGGEYDALLGMSELLSSTNAPDLICEINPWCLQHLNLDSDAITNYLANFGYSVYNVDKLSRIYGHSRIRDDLVHNIFCTKKPVLLDN